jgi:hypothetical protein
MCRGDCALTNLLCTEIDLNLLPSPPWGRGWPATGAFISRGGTGEGVKTVAPIPILTVYSQATISCFHSKDIGA